MNKLKLFNKQEEIQCTSRNILNIAKLKALNVTGVEIWTDEVLVAILYIMPPLDPALPILGEYGD